MFESSLLLFLEYVLLNIFIPFIPWLLFLWIFYGDKFKWILLYLLSRFVWVWVVAFSLLNIQFIHFWVWVPEYFVILWLLLIVYFLKLYHKKQNIYYYIQTLKIENEILQIKKSFIALSITEGIFTIIILLYSLWFICISWLYCFNLPTWGYDSFRNRNPPAYNIYIDWWIHLCGDESDILWRWRLGYPIYIPAYKTLISRFMWWIDDIYFNMRQWLVFLFWLLFIFSITFKKTSNIFKSILPIWLFLWLPLVFAHSVEWLMDLPLTIYCIILAWLFYQYLESKDFDYLSLWLLFWFIVSNIKNDGFVVFFPWLLMALFVILCLNKDLKSTIKWFFKDKWNLRKSVWYFIYFLVPFLVVRFINWLWFNQAGYERSGIWLTGEVHREIFPYFKKFFIEMDNYNLILIILPLIIILSFIRKWKNNNDKLFILAWLFIFLILMAVFLFTVDYRYFIDGSTVNRVFTMCFLIVLSFSWFLLNEK